MSFTARFLKQNFLFGSLSRMNSPATCILPSLARLVFIPQYFFQVSDKYVVGYKFVSKLSSITLTKMLKFSRVKAKFSSDDEFSPSATYILNGDICYNIR